MMRYSSWLVNATLTVVIAVTGAALSVPTPTSPEYMPAEETVVSQPVQNVEDVRAPEQVVADTLTMLNVEHLTPIFTDLNAHGSIYGTGEVVAGQYHSAYPATIFIDENFAESAAPHHLEAVTVHEAIHALLDSAGDPTLATTLPGFAGAQDALEPRFYDRLTERQQAIELAAACLEHKLYSFATYLEKGCPQEFTVAVGQELANAGHPMFIEHLQAQTPTRQALLFGHTTF